MCIADYWIIIIHLPMDLIGFDEAGLCVVNRVHLQFRRLIFEIRIAGNFRIILIVERALA